ncbi:MAG: flavin reductase [Chloroflexi bacterium]|nr:flavin reductase [Chloroflexota bacterium]
MPILNQLISADAPTFRQVMRRFATGVTLLTTRESDHVHGMTANSFTSVSLDPLLALVCIKKNNATHQHVAQTKIFAINILSAAHIEIAKRFAHQVPQPPDPFFDLAYHSAATGAPILDDCIAYLDCRVVAAHSAGDHTIFIGEVHALGFGTARAARPLIWLDGKYVSLSESQ